MQANSARFLGCLFLLALIPGGVLVQQAQVPCSRERTYQHGAFGWKDCHGNFTPDGTPAFKQNPSTVAETVQGPSDPREAALAYERDVWRQKYEKKIYEWQFYSSLVLFVVSIAVVACGLYFAYIQFKLAKLTGQAENLQELTIDTHGIALKSSYLGVVILALSLAFLFLYLHFVYPITTGG